MEFHLRRYALNWGVALVTLTMFFMAFSFFVGPPRDFPIGAVVVVASGASARAVAHNLADAGIVRHPEFLRLLWRVTGTEEGIPMGAYRFAAPQNLFIVAWRLAEGDYGIPAARITFVEGTTVREMATKVADA
ncbi:MAG: endolytic transglycosylase MltG, partial [bacterium]|nr:endolytic transglycosylase MltG [bacterium]